MTREEIKALAVQTFGFEHSMTILIFKIDEWYKDDIVALTLMEVSLEEGMKEITEEGA